LGKKSLRSFWSSWRELGSWSLISTPPETLSRSMSTFRISSGRLDHFSSISLKKREDQSQKGTKKKKRKNN